MASVDAVAGRGKVPRLRVGYAAAGAVICFVLLGAMLRFSTLGRQSYWYDESTTVYLTRLSFGDMLRGVWEHETTPPLYYAAAWLWSQLFGDSEGGLRALSAVVGTATIPVAYAAARSLLGRHVAVGCAALVAASPALIWYSQEARSYSFLVFFSALSFLFFARAIASHSRRDLLCWGIASAAALAAHYFAGFVVGPEAVWLLWRSNNRRAVLISVGIVAIAAAFLAPIALHQRGRGVDWIGSWPLGHRLHDTLTFFGTGIHYPTNRTLAALVLVGMVPIALGLWRLDDGPRKKMLLTLGVVAAGVGVPLLGAVVGSDYVLDRNLLAVWVPLAVLISAPLAARGPRWMLAVAGLCVLILCAFFLRYDYRIATDGSVQRDDWRGVAKALGPARGPRVILVSPAFQSQPLTLYLSKTAPVKRPTAVAEVDTIVYNGTLPRPSRLPRLDPAFQVPRLDPAFEVVGTQKIQRMTIVRRHAAHPADVAPPPPPSASNPDPPAALIEAAR